MQQDALRGKIMNEVKSQIRGIVNEAVAKINTKHRLKDKIKLLVAEELKRMVTDDSGGEIYDDVQEYDDVLKETPRYVLVTVDPRHYWGDRAYGLYIKLSADDVEQMGL